MDVLALITVNHQASGEKRVPTGWDQDSVRRRSSSTGRRPVTCPVQRVFITCLRLQAHLWRQCLGDSFASRPIPNSDGSEHHADPGEILRALNYRLAVVSPTENFATMCVAMVDSDRRTMRYASAGHEIGLILKADGQLFELPSTGLVLGITDETNWTTKTRDIGPGDRLLLVTDGVTEATDREGKLFGRKRLADTFRECRGIEFQQAIQHIGDAIAEYSAGNPQTDDVTLLAFEISESPLKERSKG